MTNLNKLYTLYDVHSHNKGKVKDLLSNHLPSNYTKKVQDNLLSEGIEISRQSIRQVKLGTYKNLAVFNELLEVAIQNKHARKKLTEILKKA
ncbi:hypothetical protein JJL45_05360 [Tamlana sp. s12]|uniref:hypothetical protein n=1 Tax=Tamlana sp. s12 TaxID=1630406 RepID=UPI0007FC9E38|nr:hypothetical protein [Tamlana sp. s12]OBQ56067.1 hypothetical protein VQ01_06700 [Tamlana sp. s12]QQY83420.1 hypothetical protein JJL45_05360 [Tamlana sp. s12]